MSELRQDPIQKRWVIIATERAARPTDFEVVPESEKANACPFCEGHEDQTPGELFAYRKEGTVPNRPGWKVRVVPNKFPALRTEGHPERHGVGLYATMNGVGAHELIVETPDHGASLADLDNDHIFHILATYRRRIIDLKKDPRFKYILIFKNHGAVAGASLRHPHTQLIALPVTPRTVAVELDTSRAHFEQKERCLICDLMAQELDSGKRIVRDDDHFVVIAPYASRFPFECWVIPRVHSCAFEATTDEGLHHLAVTMKDILVRLKIGLKDPPYNFILHTSPNTEAEPTQPAYWQTLEYDYHWHFEIMPRLTRIAGFEWGTGFYINPMPPEEATQFLRGVVE